jgi:hypothetical protein
MTQKDPVKIKSDPLAFLTVNFGVLSALIKNSVDKSNNVITVNLPLYKQL